LKEKKKATKVLMKATLKINIIKKENENSIRNSSNTLFM